MKFRPLRAALVGCCLVLPGLAGAATLNAPGAFTPTGPIVDFESFPRGTVGPITVGEMTVSGPGSVDSTAGFIQFPNIVEGFIFGFAAGDYTISFSTDVSDIGFGLFDPNEPSTVVRAFDRSGTLLESLNPPLGPVGGVFSTYVGFSRTQGDIASVVVGGGPGEILGVDNIAWRVAGTTPPQPQPGVIPLPAAGWLLIGGLAGMAAIGRRRRA